MFEGNQSMLLAVTFLLWNYIILLISNFFIQAEMLFMKGVELERTYHHYDAIQYYRKALQLVPDIDKRMYKDNKLKDIKNQENKGTAVISLS